ncbi:hypothetical protein AB0I72_19360 [Nocardiopsis sp. NPDC049922]|uniref:hypothetical protein n=1 Tax=Nocardiopsis sp. NPDC049922 TaxID=3155157 RepID=UPI00340850D1
MSSTSLPTADARAALNALVGCRARVIVTRGPWGMTEVIEGELFSEEGLYGVHDAITRYPGVDVHVDHRHLVSVEEAAPRPASYRDGVRDALNAAAREVERADGSSPQTLATAIRMMGTAGELAQDGPIQVDAGDRDDLRERIVTVVHNVLDRPNGMAYRGALPAALLPLIEQEAHTRDARIRELEEELDRLRTRQEYATSDWIRPAGLDEVLDAFEHDHRPWPQVPQVRNEPIAGHIRHIISLLAGDITRVALEQADHQMRLDADRAQEGAEETPPVSEGGSR